VGLVGRRTSAVLVLTNRRYQPIDLLVNTVTPVHGPVDCNSGASNSGFPTVERGDTIHLALGKVYEK
jgi:hypothetical protein